MTLQYKLTVKRVFLTNFNSTSTNRFNVPNYLSRAKCLLSKQCKWGLFIWNIGTESNLSVVLFTRSLIQFCWLPTDIHVCTSSMHVDIKGSHNTMQQRSGQWYGSIAFEGLQETMAHVCAKAIRFAMLSVADMAIHCPQQKASEMHLCSFLFFEKCFQDILSITALMMLKRR